MAIGIDNLIFIESSVKGRLEFYFKSPTIIIGLSEYYAAWALIDFKYLFTGQEHRLF